MGLTYSFALSGLINKMTDYTQGSTLRWVMLPFQGYSCKKPAYKPLL
jgi:hypothetical protein